MATPAFAQFNDTMDEILAQDKLTLGAASFILLSSAGELDDSSSLEQAASALSAKIPGISADWNEEINLGQYSSYLMKVHSVKGGLMYRMCANGPLAPRYALRELRFLEIVQGRAYTPMSLSGERAVRILGRLLSTKEATK